MRRLQSVLVPAFLLFMSVAILLPARASAVTIKEVKSDKGVVAWLVEDYSVPVVTLNAGWRGGAAQDPAGKAGLANIMSGLLDEGAGDIDSDGFQTRLSDLNVELRFDADKDAFYGTLRTLSTNTDEAFRLLQLAITAPRFDDEPVARIKGQIVSNLKRNEADPDQIAGEAWAKTLFPDHPYGRQTEGTIPEVQAITAGDLRAFHAKMLARDNLFIAVVGAIDEATLKTLLDRTFGPLPEKADLVRVADVTPTFGTTVHKAFPVPQTVIRIGGQGIKRDDPDYIPAFVANHIIGGGTFSSRLYREIREVRGLAYSVGTGLVSYDHAGTFVAAAATKADAAQTAIDIMTKEIKAFGDVGPTAEELSDAKDFLVGNYALRFDDSRKIARQLLGIQMERLGIDYIVRRNDLVRAVTLDDVKRVAKRIFGGPVTVVTAGPASS